ncbi:hypothetical protein EDB19DRAFT_2046967 [Suillus lakei]|nr:hypothetical protein EDB19DRAFT_2046967 [Suillus lakei]
MHSDDNCVASRNNNGQKTATQTYAIYCGRQGCAVVFLYEVGTDWPTVSRLINEHWHACTNGTDVVAPPYPRSDTYGTQHTPNPPQLAPESWSMEDGNHDKAIAGRRKQNKTRINGGRNLRMTNIRVTYNPHSSGAVDVTRTSALTSGPSFTLDSGPSTGANAQEKKLTRTKRDFDLSKTEQRTTATSSFRASGDDSEEGHLISFTRRTCDSIATAGNGKKGDGRTSTPLPRKARTKRSS